MSEQVKAALYFRQSLDVQEGIERQRARCTALAAARGWDIAGEYVDNDTSASKARADGTAWARLLEDARAGQFDVVVAVDLDRLLRSVRDLVTLTDTGAKVLTVDGEIDLTTADGEFRATMLAGIARFEARRKGERQLRANAHAALQGRRTGGRRPFGYEPDGVTLRPVEAAAVADGYRSLLIGVPLAGIARDWHARGLFTGSARYSAGHQGEPSEWSASAVRTVLRNPRYMGKRAHRGEIVADAQWPSIVDEGTWLAAQAILTDPARRHAPARGRYLLSGLALCGVCGAHIHAGGRARADVPGYRCSGSAGHFARKSAPVDEFVESEIVARLSAPDALELLAAPEGDDGPDLAVEAVGLRARLDALATEFADGSLTSSQLRIATQRLRERLTDIEGRMADAARVDGLSGLVGAVDVGTAWGNLSVDRKRAVIGALATVTVHPPGRGRRTFDPSTVIVEWLT